MRMLIVENGKKEKETIEQTRFKETFERKGSYRSLNLYMR